MTQSPFPDAAPDFNDPLGLLRACHQRILHHCETLERLPAHLRDHGLDAAARTAVGNLLRYFTTAGRHHHQDEEQDLFPLLARQSLKLADRVHRLHQDHARMETLWQALEPFLKKPDPAQVPEAAITEFVALYRDHIGRENDDLLEMAHHILSNADLKKLGTRMAERRGIRHTPQ